MHLVPVPDGRLIRRKILGTALVAPFLAATATMGMAASDDSDALFAPNAAQTVFASGFGFIEGLVWVPDGDSGYPLFSDIPANVVCRAETDGKYSVYLEKRGW